MVGPCPGFCGFPRDLRVLTVILPALLVTQCGGRHKHTLRGHSHNTGKGNGRVQPMAVKPYVLFVHALFFAAFKADKVHMSGCAPRFRGLVQSRKHGNPRIQPRNGAAA